MMIMMMHNLVFKLDLLWIMMRCKVIKIPQFQS